MTDIFNFEKALKLSWICKIVQQTNSHWQSLLTDNGYNINSIPVMGKVILSIQDYKKTNFGTRYMYSIIGKNFVKNNNQPQIYRF